MKHYEIFKKHSLSETLLLIAKDIQNAGGELFLVWGCVRDMILWMTPNDLDVEIYWLDFQALEKMLTSYGTPLAVWKVFGILKLSIQGEYIDFSLPRKDSKIADWHAWFQIEIDSSLSYSEASKRRDFTINSMLYNPM
jgi:tRNA nucleotidyltransferase (CCA-adding enzyme)